MKLSRIHSLSYSAIFLCSFLALYLSPLPVVAADPDWFASNPNSPDSIARGSSVDLKNITLTEERQHTIEFYGEGLSEIESGSDHAKSIYRAREVARSLAYVRATEYFHGVLTNHYKSISDGDFQADLVVSESQGLVRRAITILDSIRTYQENGRAYCKAVIGIRIALAPPYDSLIARSQSLASTEVRLESTEHTVRDRSLIPIERVVIDARAGNWHPTLPCLVILENAAACHILCEITDSLMVSRAPQTATYSNSGSVSPGLSMRELASTLEIHPNRIVENIIFVSQQDGFAMAAANIRFCVIDRGQITLLTNE